MNRRIIDALESCIKSMEADVPLEDCLKRHPDISPDLRDLVKTAEIIKQLRVENIPTESMNKSLSKVLSQANKLNSPEMRSRRNLLFDWLLGPTRQVVQSLRSLNPIASRLVLVLGITGIFILFSGGLLVTSAKSLPGDSLYTVKRAVEDIRFYFAPSGEVRHEYEDNYSQQRVDEIKRLIGLARMQRISFEGIVISIGDTRWIVSGIPVNIQSDTTVVAGTGGMTVIEPGMRVEVEGITSPQGWVTANEIHLREYQFIGSAEEISTHNWQVSGTKLFITSSTQIDAGILVGDDVTVLIRSEDDGLFALAILRHVQLTATPTMFRCLLSTPTPSEDHSSENADLHQIIGILDGIGLNYWIVGGDVIYIVSDTQIAEGINIGDKLSVTYRVEANGSFTAIEIERSENDENSRDKDEQETPETTIGSPTEDETEVSTQTPEHKGTPEPTDDHLDPN